MPGLNPVVQTEGEVLRELLQLPQIHAHFHHEVIEFGLEGVPNAVAEQLGEPPEHEDGVAAVEADPLEVVDTGEELLVDGAGEEVGVAGDVGDAEGPEEEEGGAEVAVDVGGGGGGRRRGEKSGRRRRPRGGGR